MRFTKICLVVLLPLVLVGIDKAKASENQCINSDGSVLKNQTHPNVISALSRKARASKIVDKIPGVAIYLIPDPEKGISEYKKVLVKDITYEEAIKRGENTVAFKWFPYMGKDITPWDPFPQPVPFPHPPHPFPPGPNPTPPGPFPPDPFPPLPEPDPGHPEPLPPLPHDPCQGFCGPDLNWCYGPCFCGNGNFCR